MKFIIFLLSIILLAILPVKSSIIIEEPQSETASTPLVLNTNYYDDGTIVVRIVRVNYTAPPKTCVEGYLAIRTIYPNGTVKGFDLSLDTLNIQPFNFCFFIPKFNPIRIYPVRKFFLFLTYAEAEDVNNPFTYDDWGMVIDLDGVIHSKIKLGPSFVNITTKEWLPGQDSITLNVHRDNGFLRSAPITNSTSYSLQQFKIDENGEIQQIVETVSLSITERPLETVATMDGGYAIIYANISPYMVIRGLFLEYGNSKEQGPFVLYQIPNPVSDIILLVCDFNKVGFGQTCIVVLKTASATDHTFIKIDFLSTGTVYNITIFQNFVDLTDFAIQSLQYGGYFLYSTAPILNDKTKLNLYGYILDDHSNHYNWSIPYPVITNFNGDILILPNNTLVIPQPEIGQTWGLITTDLYKIRGAHDHGYGNLHIFSTIPNIGDIIDPSEINSLIIKFYCKVDLSPNRKITILQDGGIIRQTTSVSNNNGDFVKFIDDYTIEIKVISSTFNTPNAKYYVLLDDGFVKSKDLQEPILGIQDYAWKFMTIQQEVKKGISNMYEKQLNASSIYGKVRLTAERSNYFKSFKNDKIKVKEFFDNLTQELAIAIPVDSERITTRGKHEIDTSASPEQYILSININKAKNKNESSVNFVANDLDTLIKNKLITVIGSGEYTNYLDVEYGYKTIPRWIEENLGSLIGTIVFNVILLSFAYWNKTLAIFTCGNAIEKFVSTILFISKDANSVENIFPASLFFVTFPFIVNLGFAFKVVIDELMRNDLNESLERIRKLKDDLVKEGNNSTVKDGSEKENNINEVVKKLTKVLRETRKELVIIEKEFIEVSNLAKELKVVNVLLEKLKNPNPDDIKVIMKKLRGINDLVGDLMQVENFGEELIEVCKNLNELDKLLELNKINAEVNREEPKEATKYTEGIGEKFANELSNIGELIEELKEVVELKEQLNKAVDGFKKKGLTSEKEKLDSFKTELEKASIDDHNMKRWCNKFINLGETCGEETEKLIGKDQPEKKYRKISKWLRDYKDNQIIVIIFTILTGVDISHLELLRSKLRIRIPSLNCYFHKTRNIDDVKFNVKLSYAEELFLFWGNVTNIFIVDISTITIQYFYLAQVVSFGYTPIYVISKSIIHLFINLHHIYKYKHKFLNATPGKFGIKFD